MVCEHIGGAVACGPPRGVYTLTEIHFCECAPTSQAIESWGGAWYGPEYLCQCGDSYMDGERMPRPFQRAWRKKAQKKFHAKAKYAAPKSLYDAYVKADFDLQSDDDWEAAAERRDAIHQQILDHAEAIHQDELAKENQQ